MNISRMKKAELVKFAGDAGLDATGTVKDLRARINEFLLRDLESDVETLAKDEEGEVLGTVSVSISMKEELAEVEAESDEADAEAVEAAFEESKATPMEVHMETDEETEARIVAESEEVPVPEEVVEDLGEAVLEAVASCGNCGTDLARFHTFPDPETGKPRCPNCGRAQ